MTPLLCFRIAFEFWAIIFGVIAGICVYATRSHERKAAVTLTWMFAVDAMINAADILLVVSWETARHDALASHILPSITYVCAFAFILITVRHVSSVIEAHGGRAIHGLEVASTIVAGIGMVAVIASQVCGSVHVLDELRWAGRLDSHPLLVVLLELALLPMPIQVARNRLSLRKAERIVFVCNYFLMAVGFLVQHVLEEHPCVQMAYALTLIDTIIMYQLVFASDNIERERALARMQVHLYTRQIQPHFIYNSLSAIRSKLPEDSEVRESLNHFAGFMRGSVDLLSAEGCIRASREFATVRDYLYMEQERFGDALSVVTDFEDEDFDLPPFTVQTLVENAIHYGIRENRDGRGRLTIKSYRSGAHHVIEVSDDGVGFDTNKLSADRDGHAHIGLNNIQKRLDLMCNGSLLVESTPGEGTLATVLIPIA